MAAGHVSGARYVVLAPVFSPIYKIQQSHPGLLQTSFMDFNDSRAIEKARGSLTSKRAETQLRYSPQHDSFDLFKPPFNTGLVQ